MKRVALFLATNIAVLVVLGSSSNSSGSTAFSTSKASISITGPC